jgi:exosome complex exonuclease DIS3/RRP44
LLPRSAWKKIATHQILAPVDAESEELEAAAASGFDEEGNESKSQDEVIPRDQFIRENPSAPALPTATVVGILKREVVEIVVTVPKFLNSTQGQLAIASASPTAAVSGDQSSSREEYVLCVPLNRKLPKIRIRTRKWQAIQGQRVVVGLDSWAIDSRYPEGHFTKCLGPKGDWKTEIEALLIKHSVFPRPFSVAALACLPPVPIQHEPLAMDSSIGGAEEPEFKSRKRNENQWRYSGWVPPAASLEGRRDMRSHRIFSVDPPGCQDIDDAMSIEWICDGLVEISVHIADVCAFVEQNSPLDLEAQVRSTTIYLSHKRIDMLPSLLSSDIASLHGNKERYALSMSFRVSVTHKDGSPVKESENQKAMELDDNGDIIFDIPTLPSWAGRSVIVSPSPSS